MGGLEQHRLATRLKRTCGNPALPDWSVDREADLNYLPRSNPAPRPALMDLMHGYEQRQARSHTEAQGSSGGVSFLGKRRPEACAAYC